MPEVRFYHLSATPLEANLPPMLEMALERGWRVVVRCGSEAGMAMLDTALWTWRDDAFLPHGTAAAGHAAEQPVYLTLGEENPNGATVLMLVDGARATPAEMARLRAHLPDLRRRRRARRSPPPATTGGRCARPGSPAVYWAQERGRWVEKAAAS